MVVNLHGVRVAVGPWTQEHTNYAVMLDGNGLYAREIAEQLNIKFGTDYTRNAVIGKLNRIARAVKRRSG